MTKAITSTGYLGQIIDKEMKMCKDLYVLGQGISDPFYTGDFYAQLNKNNQTRVIDAPISENLIASIGIGGAITGAKLIVIFPRMDFSLYAMNAIVNEAGQYKFLHNGEGLNLTYIMLIENEGGLLGSKHLQNFQSVFMNFPGLSLFHPSDRNTLNSTIKNSIHTQDINIVVINKILEISNTYPIHQTNGTIRQITTGKSMTILTYGKHLGDLWNMIDILQDKDITPEIFDVGSLKKYDLDIVVQSLHRTKKLLLIDGTWKCCNWSANVIKDLYLNYGISDIKVDSFNLPETYAPANFDLESDFFITKQDIFNHILTLHYEN